MKRTLITGIATAVLMSAGLGCAALELAAGTAHAGANHWCPGDPRRGSLQRRRMAARYLFQSTQLGTRMFATTGWPLTAT
jgi:hypothetical protein